MYNFPGLVKSWCFHKTLKFLKNFTPFCTVPISQLSQLLPLTFYLSQLNCLFPELLCYLWKLCLVGGWERQRTDLGNFGQKQKCPLSLARDEGIFSPEARGALTSTKVEKR